MKFYEKERDMSISEIEKEDGTVHHLKCEGSRRHVLSYDTNGQHCSEPRCEINKPKKINIGIIGHAGQGRKTINQAILESLNRR